MLSVVFTTDNISRGGKERQLFILVSELLKRGYYVRVISLHALGISYIEEYQINNQVFIYIGQASLWEEFVLFRREIRKIKPDIIVSWDNTTSLFSLLIYRRYNIVFINGSIRHGIRLFNLSHLFRSLILWLSPYRLGNSKAGFAANNLILNNGRCFILYNGIESSFICSFSNKTNRDREEFILNYRVGSLVFVTNANFVPFKDYQTVFRALAKLKKKIDFHYIIIGDGPMHQQITDMVSFFGLKENVVFTGSIENVRDYLFVSDLMIHSSRGEGVSNAILEGMYAGLPIIATKVGGVPETVFPGSSLLFPYKDHEALYQCLLKAPELIANFDPSGEEYKAHLKKFSVETMVERFEEIINKVIKKK